VNVPQLSREEIARTELGKTEIAPWLARVLTTVFLVTSALPVFLEITMHFAKRGLSVSSPTVPNSQAVVGLPQVSALFPNRRHAGLTFEDLSSLVPSAQRLRDFEDRLDRTSLATRTLAPWVGYVIKGMLHGGDEQVCFGRDGWLFYRPSVESVTGPGFLTPEWQQDRIRAAEKSPSPPQPDPVKALLQFNQQLAARGIALVIVPAPGKETLYPEKLARGWDTRMRSPQNASYERFKSQLAKAGVNIFDPMPILLEMKKVAGQGVYLKTDTHWSAPAMEHVAARLAAWLHERGFVPAHDTGEWHPRTQTVRNTGDIAVMLNLPKRQRFFPPEQAQTRRVVTSEGRAWEPEANAPVLLMGDSFCNIYSLPAMGWGDSAGLAEQLSLELGQPLDRLTINAGGAYSARQELARELASGRDRLAGKRVVIYEFADRELAFGDWKLFELPTPPAQRSDGANAGDGLIVQGRVTAIARLPQPGSVPYKDCLVAIHLEKVRAVTSGLIKGDLLVYAWGMRDNQWLPASSVPVGSEIRCRLRDWTTVERQYGSYNRAELDDLDLLSLATFWAEEVTR
jgi:alginate O-acetyltransferase complex protein AlgJ